MSRSPHRPPLPAAASGGRSDAPDPRWWAFCAPAAVLCPARRSNMAASASVPRHPGTRWSRHISRTRELFASSLSLPGPWCTLLILFILVVEEPLFNILIYVVARTVFHCRLTGAARGTDGSVSGVADRQDARRCLSKRGRFRVRGFCSLLFVSHHSSTRSRSCPGASSACVLDSSLASQPGMQLASVSIAAVVVTSHAGKYT